MSAHIQNQLSRGSAQLQLEGYIFPSPKREEIYAPPVLQLWADPWGHCGVYLYMVGTTYTPKDVSKVHALRHFRKFQNLDSARLESRCELREFSSRRRSQCPQRKSPDQRAEAMPLAKQTQVLPQFPQSFVIRFSAEINETIQQPTINVIRISVALDAKGAGVKPVPIFEFLWETRELTNASASQSGATPFNTRLCSGDVCKRLLIGVAPKRDVKA